MQYASDQRNHGDVMRALSLLSVNERVDEANARIRAPAETDEPFAYFGAVDFVRILALFNSRSPHLWGRSAIYKNFKISTPKESAAY